MTRKLIGRPPRSMRERFEEKVMPVTESGCWLWLASVWRRSGYGRIHYGTGHGKSLRAHRVSYELYCGPIPSGLLVLHRCDVRSCVNPNHLFLGTHTDNVRDAVKKKRNYEVRRTHCPKGHPYSPENTRMHAGARECKTCDRARCRAYYRRTHKEAA